MKKTLLCIITIALGTPSFAQWTTSGNDAYTLNGKVGIGTQTPDGKLSIVASNTGGIYIKGNSGSFQGSDLSITRTSVSPTVGFSPCIQFGEVNTVYGALIQSYKGQFQFFNAAENGWRENLRITADGRIGIGTATPDYSLTVNGNFKVSTNNDNNYFGYNAADLFLKFANRGSGGRAVVHDNDNRLTLNYAGDFTGGTTLGKYAYFTESVGGTSYLNNGNLAIGTTDAHGFRLAVNGSIRAQEVKVESDHWPDYVFKPSYHLPTLSALNWFINKYRHLPDMPSETEVAINGISLGKMITLQTRKIEELTLYLIEKDRQLKEQAERLSNQQKELKLLRQQQNDRLSAMEKTLTLLQEARLKTKTNGK